LYKYICYMHCVHSSHLAHRMDRDGDHQWRSQNFARGGAPNYKKIMLGDTAAEIHAINSDKAIGLYNFVWVGNHIESNVRVYAALK